MTNHDTMRAAEAIDDGNGNGEETRTILRSIDGKLGRNNGKPSKQFYVSIVGLGLTIAIVVFGGLWKVSRWVAMTEITNRETLHVFTAFVEQYEEHSENYKRRFEKLESDGSTKANNNELQVAILTQDVSYIKDDVKEIKKDIKQVLNKVKQ